MGVKGVTRKYMSNLKIPLPPLDIQKQIVQRAVESAVPRGLSWSKKACECLLRVSLCQERPLTLSGPEVISDKPLGHALVK